MKSNMYPYLHYQLADVLIQIKVLLVNAKPCLV